MISSEATVEVIRKDNTSFLETLDRHGPGILKLKVWFCKVKDFTPLSKLSQLEDLEIAEWPHESFEIIRNLKSMRRLSVIHFPKVVDLNALESLQGLKKLSLETLPSWDPSGKKMHFATLESIGRVSELEELRLHGIAATKLGLRPLAALTRLRRLSVDSDFQIEDYAYLATKLPAVSGGLGPFWENPSITCKICGAVIQFFRGKGMKRSRRYSCPRCNPNLVARHRALYESLREKYASADFRQKD